MLTRGQLRRSLSLGSRSPLRKSLHLRSWKPSYSEEGRLVARGARVCVANANSCGIWVYGPQSLRRDSRPPLTTEKKVRHNKGAELKNFLGRSRVETRIGVSLNVAAPEFHVRFARDIMYPPPFPFHCRIRRVGMVGKTEQGCSRSAGWKIIHVGATSAGAGRVPVTAKRGGHAH